MMLENTIIKLRALEPEDLEVLYQWENDTRLWRHGITLSPYSKLALRQYIEDALREDIYQSKQLRLMIDLKAENKTIGTIDLYDLDIRNQRAGIGILIDESYRQLNYASETLDVICKYAFDYLNLHQLYAYIAKDNTSSIKLFEKIGFKQSGILNDWLSTDTKFSDVYIYQLIQLMDE